MARMARSGVDYQIVDTRLEPAYDGGRYPLTLLTQSASALIQQKLVNGK